MSERSEKYRADLKKLRDWEPYLKKHSGLPGPRANLELAAVVGDEADADRLWRLSASSDEFLALCGTAGLGRLVTSDPETVLAWLRELASDQRWRVREGVAMALQRVGRESMPRLIAEMRVWVAQAPYVQRAAAAALCEPALLKDPAQAREVLLIIDGITSSLAAAMDRRDEGFRVLRQALGYCWSVAAAAAPAQARPLIERWLRSDDADVAWIMKANLGKARMSALGKDWVARQGRSGATLKSRLAPKAKSKPKTQPKAGRARRIQA
jgi:HEAT repeats